MKIRTLLITGCLLSSTFALAKPVSTKQLVSSLSASLQQNHTSENPELMQPISHVKGHYNPYTGATLVINFAQIEQTEHLNKQLINSATEDKKQQFLSSQQQAKALSHHIFQLERKLSMLEKSDKNSEQAEETRRELSELTIAKAKTNNQYQSAKKGVLTDVISTNTQQNLQKHLSAFICHLTDDEKRSLNMVTLVLSGIQNNQQEITWHFSNLQSCQDNSLSEQTNFANSRLTSTF
ncbi:hypothetical protein AAEU29_08330 [Pseudoalteromonas sp. SSM20]|uniref:hypothetical protein n=1 Tax=Pseudoalteromonas sp. SSM20 TaxID=3139394 RepID=UPI003BAB399D